MPTPYEAARLNLQLFDLRREPVLREARQWYLNEFHPETFDDAVAIIRGPRNAAFRMVVGYWDMAASLVTSGAIDAPSFVAAHGEILSTYALVAPFVQGIREAPGNRTFFWHVEQLIAALPEVEAVLAQRRAGLRGGGGPRARRATARTDRPTGDARGAAHSGAEPLPPAPRGSHPGRGAAVAGARRRRTGCSGRRRATPAARVLPVASARPYGPVAVCGDRARYRAHAPRPRGAGVRPVPHVFRPAARPAAALARLSPALLAAALAACGPGANQSANRNGADSTSADRGALTAAPVGSMKPQADSALAAGRKTIDSLHQSGVSTKNGLDSVGSKVQATTANEPGRDTAARINNRATPGQGPAAPPGTPPGTGAPPPRRP